MINCIFFLQIYESNVTFQKQTEFVRYSLSVTEGRNNCEHQVNMHSDIHSGRQDESVFSRGQLDLYISCVIIFNNCPTKTPEITAVLPPPRPLLPPVCYWSLSQMVREPELTPSHNFLLLESRLTLLSSWFWQQWDTSTEACPRCPEQDSSL